VPSHIGIDPHFYPTAFSWVGAAHERQGDHRRAQAVLLKARSGRHAGRHLQLANRYLKQRELTAASSELQAYLRANPSDPQAPAIQKTLANIAANQKN